MYIELGEINTGKNYKGSLIILFAHTITDIYIHVHIKTHTYILYDIYVS